jgi:hypothetical protein
LKFEELNLNGERHLKMSWQDIAAILEEVWSLDYMQTFIKNKRVLSAKKQRVGL